MAPTGVNVFGVDPDLVRRTPGIVWYSVMLFNMAGLYLGFDQVMFSALQATPSFVKDFAGSTKLLSAKQASIMNSVPLVGKFIGCFLGAPINQCWGYKTCMLLGAIAQCLGIVLELVSHNWGVFTAGRILLYPAVGLAENGIPIYQAEIVLPQYRGFFSGVYLLAVAIGALWASAAVRTVSTRTDSLAWMSVCLQQFAPTILIMIGLYWCPASPRWLLEKGRREAGYANLRRVRTPQDQAEGWVTIEMAAIEESLELDRSLRNGTWLELFTGTNWRRTMVGSVLFIGNNWTGNTFISIYSTTLYVQLGLVSQAFNYNVIKGSITIVACLIGMVVVDKVGRRPILIVGCAMQAVFQFIIGGVGSISNPSDPALRLMVACIMLHKVFVVISLQFLCPTITAEIAAPSLRKKTFAFACCVDVATAVAVSYASPYMINPANADLGAKVGYIFGSISIFFVAFCALFVPELGGRSLEEVDELFEARLWAWQFKGYQTRSLGRSVVDHRRKEEEAMEQDGKAMGDNVQLATLG